MNGMKNKIGIVTFHRAYNYGSVLQAYALNYYLNKMGMQAETIDFWTERQEKMYGLFEKKMSFMGIIRNFQAVLEYPKLKKKKRRFEKFIEENILLGHKRYKTLEELKHEKLDYDYYICGGDQIWNPNCTDFDMTYLLDFVEDKKRCLSFAPSIGIQELNEEYITFFDKVKEFKLLSVREATGKRMLQDLIGRNVEVISDPVLLLKKEEWMKFVDCSFPMKNYIFCYFIGDVEGMRSYVKKLGKTGKKIIVIQKSIRDVLYKNKKMYDAGPEEFLNLLYHAESVVTDSYHATIFSTIFQKKFWTFLKPESVINSNSRIIDFSKKFGLSDRIVYYANPNIVEYEKEVDFKMAEEQLEVERKKSEEYLKMMF